MIKTIFKLPVFFCIATCIAELIYLGYLTSQGNLGWNQIEEITAVVYGVDRESMASYVEESRANEFREPVDLRALGEEELLRSLDIDVREKVIGNATNDLMYYEQSLTNERDRYEALRLAFENRMRLIGETSTSRDVVDLSETLQAMTPAQAKEQLIRLYELSRRNVDEEIANDVVAIIRTMPMDKQKKIIAEFTSDEDKQRLGEILRLIRTGAPEVPLIKRTREQLEEFDPRIPESEP